MRNILYILFIICGLNIHLKAQIRSNFSQFQENPYLLNPALVGLHDYLDVNLHKKVQWDRIQGGPVLNYLSLDSKIGKDFKLLDNENFIGLGINYFENNSHINKEFGGGLSYAIHQKRKNGTFSIGMSSEIILNRINFDNLNAKQPDDPELFGGENSSSYWNFRIGINRSINKNINFGAAILSIQTDNNHYNQDGTSTLIMKKLKNGVAYFNYSFPKSMDSANFVFTPCFASFFWSAKPSAYLSYANLDYFASVRYKENAWLSIGTQLYVKPDFRIKNIITSFGLWAWKDIGISFSYEIPIGQSNMHDVFGNTFELHLKWKIGRRVEKIEKDIQELMDEKNKLDSIATLYKKTREENKTIIDTLINYGIPSIQDSDQLVTFVNNQIYTFIRSTTEIQTKSSEADAISKAILEIFNKYTDRILLIGGHCDTTDYNANSDDKNDSLSKARTDKIKLLLVQSHVPIDKIYNIGYGKKYPNPKGKDEKNPEKKAEMDRRIEFFIGRCENIRTSINNRKDKINTKYNEEMLKKIETLK